MERERENWTLEITKLHAIVLEQAGDLHIDKMVFCCQQNGMAMCIREVTALNLARGAAHLD